ncbi:MAG: DUF6249 domain-containing protein, partial [Bacteroidales bacterium]
MEDIVPVFVLAIIFGFVYAVIFLLVRKKERMALLEKGVDAAYFITPIKNVSFFALKIGLLLIGLGVGTVLGEILIRVGSLDEEVSYLAMIFLFGGIGLVVSHFMEKHERAEMEKAS